MICAEAARAPDSAPHVASPLPPTVLYGVDPMAALEIHDQHIVASKNALRGTGVRIRIDTHTLACCVASYPDFTRPAPDGEHSMPTINDPGRREAYERWKTDVIAFMQADAERSGRRILSIVEHLDEDHPHLHSIEIADNRRADCKVTHPGLIAKAASMKAGAKDSKTARRAYKMAMSAYQDDYFRAVGVKHGQARTGPKRRRLSRTAWNAEQREAQAAAVRLATLQNNQVAAITMSAAAERKEAAARSILADAQKEAAAIIKKAEEQAAETLARQGEIETHYRALDRGIDALSTGEIEGPHPRLKDAFTYGSMPLEKRVSLDREINPARHRIWVFAKKISDFLSAKIYEIIRREERVAEREAVLEARIQAIEPYLDVAERRAIDSVRGYEP